MDFFSNLGYLGLGSRFKRISDVYMSDVSKIYSEHHLEFEPRWFPTYSLLLEKEELSVVEISDTLKITHTAANQVVNDMVKKGVARFFKNKSDKRKKMVALTQQGRDMEKDLQVVWKVLRQAVEISIKNVGYDIIDVLTKLEQSMTTQSLYQIYQQQHEQHLLDEVKIIPYEAHHCEDFRRLNVEWLEKYFFVEPKDEEIFANPEEYILKAGGYIFMAEYQGEIVGTCALFKHETSYELAKMAVTEKVQGKKIGKKLALTAIAKAKELKTKEVFLETNSQLKPAIQLYRKLGFVLDTGKQSTYQRADMLMRLRLS